MENETNLQKVNFFVKFHANEAAVSASFNIKIVSNTILYKLSFLISLLPDRETSFAVYINQKWAII